ncbi:hypothetical protein CONLIGDRAFT_677231 [Coniochaeta ligniaria NRRL 30616]|uniref:Filamentation protein n=1 Tax=Coniochaeta ligniaria NRRL 30616 TaxID=1408157 RepID=A0A1J7JVM5_9PEZI|nr:hypothetical protein CONLIGDRAFT_677231 [Coniochaeta ligniaria NRRL 30616]
MSPSATKALHYLQLLDDARCEGNWDAVPELVRKIRKHAPDRSCLALTAETECAISKAAPSTRPKTAAAEPIVKELLERQPKLFAAIEQETKYPEDKFHAQVCLGWLHWVAGEYDIAATKLPTVQSYVNLESPGPVLDWSKVCALKATYLKANCLTRGGLRTEALGTCNSSLPALSGIWATNPTKKQLRYWTELFLTEYCMLFSQTLDEHEEILTDPNCLACFRSWARYWESQGASVSGGSGFPGFVPRRRIWLAYYDVISEILKQDLPFPTGYAPLNNESSARAQLRMELKKVEAKYEILLLSETTFPRAEEEREEVERFVELVMENWKILTGRGWREQDLGQGGKESLSRGVLDILYRAATKTFHSTAILRCLFTVHLAVAEFDLAFKAFDSYLDLVKRGKARVEKTGKPEPSLDDGETVLETVSSCILALCRYGDRQAAEKARALAGELEHMLENLREPGSIQEEGPSPGAENGPPSALHLSVGPAVQALCWQSMGLAHAQWARVTFDSVSRTDVQKKAIQCLRKSLSSEFGRSADIRGVFALGLLLAEQRELAVAIELVKTALLAEKSPEAEYDLYQGLYWRERSLVPLWHLLSLMLSARQDYIMAARACEGAFEQFKDPAVLFGTKSLNGGYRSDHLNEVEPKVADETTGGVVDDMDDYEKESILEVKMTQLAIVELLEGPKVAVNASIELLTLYSRLFGVPHPKVSSEPPKTRNAPKSSAGTLRSIKGSIFGSRTERHSRTRQSIMPSEKFPTRPQTTQTTHTVDTIGAPVSQVISESGTLDEPRRSRKSASVTRAGEQGGKRASLRKRESSGSRRRAVSSGAVSRQHSLIDGDGYFTPSEDTSPSNHDFFQAASKRFPSGGHRSMTPLSESYASNGSARNSRATDPLAGISVGKLEPYTALLPVIQFSKDYHTRRRTAVLVEVWLMTAGFYRRAGMYEDAEGAAAEAKKLVQGLEAEVAGDALGALSLSVKTAGWAGKKSVEELWADFWSEKAHVSLARGQPYVARTEFETALTHYPDHPSAIVGLSNILLDIYTEVLLPPVTVPGLETPSGPVPAAAGTKVAAASLADDIPFHKSKQPAQAAGFPVGPLGLVTAKPKLQPPPATQDGPLPPPYKARSLPLVDRLAARDRAYGLLSGLTRLGTGWNYSEAWFALARAHEESGQADKAKEVLWWCVELEEGRGVREWSCVGAGGYVL